MPPEGSGGIPPVMPRKPVLGSIVAAMRPLRHRMRQAREAIDRGRHGSQRDTARELVTIVDLGHIPTQPDHVFIGYPTSIDCEDSEGAIPTFTPDASQPIPVVVIRGAAVAGDRLVAGAIAGRWVAEIGGGKSKICVTACGIPLPGATVTVAGLGSCVTDPSGCCDAPWLTSGLHTFTVVDSRGDTVASGNRSWTAGSTNMVAIPFPTNGVCCHGYFIQETLTATDAIGSFILTYTGVDVAGNHVWQGGHALTLSSCTVTTPDGTCVIAAPTSGPVRVCYKFTCLAAGGFGILRYWPWVNPPDFGFQYYQDPTGFAAGPCVNSPPGPCGNPNNSTASGTTGTATASPFSVSFSLATDPGATIADPIGGGLALSA